MSEPSLPQGSVELPRQFSFTLPHTEVCAVRDYAERYAPVPSFEYCVHLKFLQGKHQWFMNEANLTAWFEFDGNGPNEGTLTLSMQQLNLMSTMGGDEEDITVHIDGDAKSFCFETGGVTTTLNLSRQTTYDYTNVYEHSWGLRAETRHIEKMGRALMSHPVNLPVEGLEEAPWPFITFSFDGTTLRAVRDWSRFGGTCVVVEIPASGAFRGEFSCFAEPFARELFYADLSDGDTINIGFSLKTPNYAYLTAMNWGIKIGLGHYHVFEHRFNVVSNLIDEDIDVEDDSRIGWDAVIRATHNERAITATIVQAASGEAHFVRVACSVMEDAPWNLQLAEEMNSWNNAWANCKLIRENNHLIVVADVLLTALDGLADTVRDVVTKANTVHDVVAVFM
jgi:hypothetical protein